MASPHDDEEAGLLDTGTVVGYLSRRGSLPDGPVRAEMLGGGVSNVVLAAGGGERAVVVKQALGRLRVAEEWYAPEERAMIEADALEFVGRITPGRVPRVIDRDARRHTLTIARAPAGWQDWKTLLLQGRADPTVAAELGVTLGSWHRRTTGVALPGSLEGTEHFEQLRLSPYYRSVAQKAPELSGRVLGLADQLLVRRVCLVHGDFSPKNVLVGPGGPWVIDFEVAHRGDPAFDVAFLLCHLTLKSLHLPEKAAGFDACAAEFIRAYQAAAGRPEPRLPYVLEHVGCLLLARVKGKSPAEYLTPSERAAAWRLGMDLLEAPAATLEQLRDRRDGASR